MGLLRRWLGRARRRAVDEVQFDRLVSEALDALPEEFARHLENVDVVVEEAPTEKQVRAAGVSGPYQLLGLYEGVPLVARGMDAPVLPDRIYIFRGPILSLCRTPAEVRARVRQVVLHEIAHHFGISDERLRELEAY